MVALLYPPDLSKGRCVGGPGGDWTSSSVAERRRAVAKCQACPVIAECRKWAIETMPLLLEKQHVVMGGLLPEDLRIEQRLFRGLSVGPRLLERRARPRKRPGPKPGRRPQEVQYVETAGGSRPARSVTLLVRGHERGAHDTRVRLACPLCPDRLPPKTKVDRPKQFKGKGGMLRYLTAQHEKGEHDGAPRTNCPTCNPREPYVPKHPGMLVRFHNDGKHEGAPRLECPLCT